MLKKYQRLIPACIVLFILTAGTITVSTHANPLNSFSAKTTSVRRAILVGINDYRSPMIPDLRGAINDIEFISKILITRYGFSEENIRKLTDSAATRQSILAALAELERDSGPEDVIYIHYSGHGSQVEDLNQDETDGVDETIVPHDGRTGNIEDITDDELGLILSRFQTPNIVVVLDSCHAGTATRSIALTTRSIPNDTRLHLYKKLSASTRAVVPLISEKYLLMTGSAANQRALDGPIDNRYHGFFTYAFGKILSTSSAQTPVKNILSGIETELERIRAQFGNINMPEPQLEAQIPRFERSLFPPIQKAPSGSLNTEASQLPWLLVQPVVVGKALLKDAVSLNAQNDSIWMVYPPGEQEFNRGRAIATALVVGFQGADAQAFLQPEGTQVPPNSRAILLSSAFPSQDVPVRFFSDSPDGIKLIQTSLQQLIASLKVVGPNEFARFIIHIEGDICRVFGAAGLMQIDEFKFSDPDIVVQRLRQILIRSLNTSELLALENPSSRVQVRVRVSGRGEQKAKMMKAQRGLQVTSNLESPTFKVRKEGAPRTSYNSLQLKVNVSEDAFITIVDVDQEGGINILFPNQYQKNSFYPDGFVQAGIDLLIPDSLAVNNMAGFNWDIWPPEGSDTIRVFACTDLETAELIRGFVSNMAVQSGTHTDARSLSSFSKLHQDLSSRAIRPIPNIPEEQQLESTQNTTIGDWNAASVTVLVQN